MGDILIRGGTVVSPDGRRRADVLCRGGIIADVGEGLAAPAGAEIIDAGGCFVLPGGVDPHTHMQLPMMGTVAADVGRPEVALRVLGDEGLLGPEGQGQPDREVRRQVVVVVQHGEGLAAPGEPGRLTVGEPLGRLGEGQADGPEPRHREAIGGAPGLAPRARVCAWLGSMRCGHPQYLPPGRWLARPIGGIGPGRSAHDRLP